MPWLIPVGHVPRSQSFHLYCWRRLACCLTLRISVFSSECTAVLVKCHSITASQGHRVLRNIIVGVVVENTFLGANTEERSNWGPHRATFFLQHVPAEVERCEAEPGPTDKARRTPTLQGVKFHRFTMFHQVSPILFNVDIVWIRVLRSLRFTRVKDGTVWARGVLEIPRAPSPHVDTRQALWAERQNRSSLNRAQNNLK